MYSLYRAWFGGEGSCGPPAALDQRSMGPVGPTVGLSPPDTLIRVGNDGEHQFVAHRSVLAAHSGYLKALLASTSSGASPGGSAGGVASLSVSSVGGEAFAPLLNYMYTGRLEVTLDNIYSVLLATHLLHMPGALEQCRAALLKLRTPPATGGVLRPVPSRVVGPPICWPPPPPPNIYSTAPIPIAGPTLAVSHASGIPTTIVTEGEGQQQQQQQQQLKARLNYRKIGDKSSPSPKPSTSTSTSQERPRSAARRSSSPEMGHQMFESRRTGVRRRSSSPGESSEQISVTDSEPQRVSRKSSRSTATGVQVEQTAGANVVIDIACCDGPVRFHRVLNANYSATAAAAAAAATATATMENGCEVEAVGENDENVFEEESQGVVGAATESGNYTCGYCRHTFKSQYCYEKHARRHLHPGNGASGQTSGRRREVRLLDLNVQYYPCKICGSKFPSYYFVHKHRKLCHGGEDNQSGSDEPTTNPSSNNSQAPASLIPPSKPQ